MRIQHNIPAMNAYRNYTNNNRALQKNLEKLSSGYRINRAGDDAAGLAISEKMRAQITGLETAQKNAKDGISLVQTAEGALTEVHDMLNRMYELAEQSANGTYQDEVDREQLQKEVESLKSEIDRIADSTNFNGIKLLDGSLSDKGATNGKISVEGSIIGTKSAATKGTYTASFATGATPVAPADGFAKDLKDAGVGDTFSFNVGLNDGTSTTLNFSIEDDGTGKGYNLVSEDGTKYAIKADTTTKKVSDNNGSAVTAAVLSELKKTSLTKEFDISSAGTGKFTFTSLKEGDAAPQVASVDYSCTVASVPKKTVALGIEPKGPLNEGVEINAADITLWDGTNEDEALFSINGHKFVVLANETDNATKVNMNPTQSLGSDVTILVASSNTTKGLKSTDANFSDNIAKIAEVTGLKVTDAVAEANFGGTANKVTPGNGIRLSAGKGSGLKLQIGDTSESFNQMTVAINDCHASAMGIGKVDISNQNSASAAVDAIKNAINYVSDVRGGLGAMQNRLDHAVNNLAVQRENIQDAEATIRDVDVAEEMMAYTKNNILVQSAQAMLAQANQLPQGVLQLLG